MLQNLDRMSALTLLELGDNRIQQLEGLDKLLSLQQLWLGRNRIAAICGLGRYVRTYVLLGVHQHTAEKFPIELLMCKQVDQLATAEHTK